MSQALLLSDPAPSIIVRSGRPATTSREVARYFNKPHDDVLKSVRRLIDVTPENFRLGNFSESSYTNEQGKTQPMFIIYRDGFIRTGWWKRPLTSPTPFSERRDSLPLRAAKGPGCTRHSASAFSQCWFSMRRPGLYEGFNPGWHLLGIMNQFSRKV